MSDTTTWKDLLESLLDRFGYKGTAERLGYSYSYVHQIANNKKKATKAFRVKLFEVYEITPPKRHRITVDMLTPENYDKAMTVPMAERRRRMLINDQEE